MENDRPTNQIIEIDPLPNVDYSCSEGTGQGGQVPNRKRPAGPAARFCPYCGERNESAATHCIRCGQILASRGLLSTAGRSGKVWRWVLVGIALLVLGGAAVFVTQTLTVVRPLQQSLTQSEQARWQSETRLAATSQELAASSQELSTARKDLETTQNERATLAEQLAKTKGELSLTTEELSSASQELSSARSELQQLRQNIAQLGLDNRNFQESALIPPYITIKDRLVHLAFFRSDGSPIQWQLPFENLESSIEKGFIQRSPALGGLEKMNLRNSKTGEVYSVVDMRPFVDPSPFTRVMADLYRECASDDQFLREVWSIIGQLTSYSSEIEETPRFPLETLLAGGGDCEDTSILYASMVKAAPANYDVELVYLDGDNPTNPQDVNHMVVAVKTGVGYHLVETTSRSEMEPYGPDGVSGWYFAVED